MLEFVTASFSDQMSLDEVIGILNMSSEVDGLAQFGAHAVHQANAASDYDLLVLVTALPAPVFQLVTTIDGRLADIVLVDLTLADRLLTEAPLPTIPYLSDSFCKKAAIRYWLQHDALCYERLQAVLAAPERAQRLQAYEQFVQYVLAAVGTVMHKGQTAVILSEPNYSAAVHRALTYWNSLLAPTNDIMSAPSRDEWPRSTDKGVSHE